MVESPPLVTGMGWCTALGSDLAAVWNRLGSGETGFRVLPHQRELRSLLAAPVPEVAFTLRAGDRLEALALTGIELALADAGVKAGDPRIQLVIGTSLGAWLDDPLEGQASQEEWAIGIAHGAGLARPPIALSTACCSGSDAIAVGAELIRAGEAEICVCGGADVLTPAKRLAHSTLGTMSRTRLRAFDTRHDGTLLGEGSGFMVLQHEHLGAPYASLLGTGAGTDVSGFTAPDPTGLGARLAISRSLAMARLEPEDVGVINAHGSGTQTNDATEGCAYQMIFGQGPGPVVFATKGNFGHTLGATGAIEAIATVLALMEEEVPPVAGLELPAQDFPLTLARGAVMPLDARYGLSLTLGFGGFNTSLLFGRLP